MVPDCPIWFFFHSKETLWWLELTSENNNKRSSNIDQRSEAVQKHGPSHTPAKASLRRRPRTHFLYDNRRARSDRDASAASKKIAGWK